MALISPRVSRWCRAHLVWATCLFNVLTGGRWEPFCARAYRNSLTERGRFWSTLCNYIDAIFPEDSHCKKAYRATGDHKS